MSPIWSVCKDSSMIRQTILYLFVAHLEENLARIANLIVSSLNLCQVFSPCSYTELGSHVWPEKTLPNNARIKWSRLAKISIVPYNLNKHWHTMPE